MITRFKQVHTSSMVAHLWANKSQPHARNASNSLFFEHSTIYSYGSHFPVAKHIEVGKKPVILFTTRCRSNTTAKHICYVRRALPPGDTANVFYVDNVLAQCKIEHLENHAAYRATAAELVKEFAKATRRKIECFARLEACCLEANCYAQVFKLRVKCLDPLKLVGLTQAELDAKLKAAELKNEAREKLRVERDEARRAALEITNAGNVEQWIAGVIKTLPRSSELPVYLRTARGLVNSPFPRNGEDPNEFGAIMETSLGATVPLEDARRALRVVLVCRERTRSWLRNGATLGATLQVGDFYVDLITETGDVVAGCHKIRWAEIERFAKSMRWL